VHIHTKNYIKYRVIFNILRIVLFFLAIEYFVNNYESTFKITWHKTMVFWYEGLIKSMGAALDLLIQKRI